MRQNRDNPQFPVWPDGGSSALPLKRSLSSAVPPDGADLLCARFWNGLNIFTCSSL